jgi:thermitase
MILNSLLLFLVIVGVIDTGIDCEQKILKNNLIEGKNLLEPTEKMKDYEEHGTAIAGIISTITPDTHIIPVAVSNELGIANYLTIFDAIEYCIENKVFVINLSLSFFEENLKYIKQRIGKQKFNESFFIIAAGNESQYCVPMKKKFDNVIIVAALRKDGLALASYSNYGDGVDVAVISGDINEGIVTCKAYSTEKRLFNGTSAAAAVVSGYIAKLKFENPAADIKSIKNILFNRCYMSNNINVKLGRCLIQNGYKVNSSLN